MKCSISLELEEFEKRKKSAIEEFNKNTDEESQNTVAQFSDLKFEMEGFEFENGLVTVYGNTPLGWIDLQFQMDLDDVISVIEFYMKKLGKLKTVLEATK